MNISETTKNVLYEIIKQCFVENRKFDRMVSVLGVKFACNKSANLIHHGIAHLFPAISDTIGEKCLERYNIDVIYGETPDGAETFGSVGEIINEMERRIIVFQAMLMGACSIAQENKDINIYADMLDVLKDFNVIVEQAILLKDKYGFYGEENIMAFDHDIDDFWILGKE